LKCVGKEGLVVGVDKRKVKDMSSKVRTIRMDIFDEGLIDVIREITDEEFDVILSDLSPDVSGVWELDSIRQIDLAERSLQIAKNLLKRDGKMVVKVFQGEFTDEFIRKLRKEFKEVRLTKPPASRPESSELFAVCLGFKR
jgi:23S rRNA (uridine2552-2'-O)-methyltransferase